MTEVPIVNPINHFKMLHHFVMFRYRNVKHHCAVENEMFLSPFIFYIKTEEIMKLKVVGANIYIIFGQKELINTGAVTMVHSL